MYGAAGRSGVELAEVVFELLQRLAAGLWHLGGDEHDGEHSETDEDEEEEVLQQQQQQTDDDDDEDMMMLDFPIRIPKLWSKKIVVDGDNNNNANDVVYTVRAE